MDSLKFVCSWKGNIQGAKLSVRVDGIQLEGCTFDGTRLSENQRDSPSFSQIPPCVVAWIPKVGALSYHRDLQYSTAKIIKWKFYAFAVMYISTRNHARPIFHLSLICFRVVDRTHRNHTELATASRFRCTRATLAIA